MPRTATFRDEDLYPDALPAIASLRAAGYRLAIVANQPRQRNAELRALGVETEVMAMSDELGVQKPSPDFFRHALTLMGSPDPAQVAYVGDRLDNDVRPAAEAGMRPIWIRRGPWALLVARMRRRRRRLIVDSLDELVARIGELRGSETDGRRLRAGLHAPAGQLVVVLPRRAWRDDDRARPGPGLVRRDVALRLVRRHLRRSPSATCMPTTTST